jgi:hypothetical protein
MGIEIELLEHEPHFSAQFVDIGLGVRKVHAVNNQFATVDGLELIDGPNQGGFAGA